MAYRILSIAAVAIVLAWQWYWRTLHLDAEAAAKGFSPELVAKLVNQPELFRRDFPGGAEELLNALPYQLYPIVDQWGFSVPNVWAGMIGLEMALMAAAAAYASATFFPRSSPISWSLTAILISSSAIIHPDVANFGFPFFGWVYGFTLAAFLMAVSDTSAGHYVRASVWLVLAFACHPINGLFTAAFIGAMLAARIQELRFTTLVVPSVIATLGIGAWTAFIASKGTLGSGGVDPTLFIALTKGQNFHWYPDALGTFWEKNARNLMPFLASVALIVLALGPRTSASRKHRCQVAAGIGAMLLLTLAGITISVFIENPTLIKLALHRAGSNAVLMGAIFVIQMLYRDLTEGEPMERALSLMLLLVSVTTAAGAALFPAISRIGYAVIKNGGWTQSDLATRASLSIAAAILALLAFYAMSGLVNLATLKHHVGLEYPLLVLAALSALLPMKPARSYGGPIVLAFVVFLLAPDSNRHATAMTPRALEAANSLKEAQLWAKVNSPAGALFMPDPAMGYVWRDKSQRPSFGTLREWLLVSIMYNSRPQLLDEGLARCRDLGFDPLPIVFDPSARRMRHVMKKLKQQARERYYAADIAVFRRLTRKYGIQYFVFDKAYLKKPLPLTTAYENKHYLIAAAP